MTNLINVWQTEKGNQAVSARELHSFLGSKQDFSNWIKNRIEKYGFIYLKDYYKLLYDIGGNILNLEHNNFIEFDNQSVRVHKIEYVITLNMAKELAMVENNERGRGKLESTSLSVKKNLKPHS